MDMLILFKLFLGFIGLAFGADRFVLLVIAIAKYKKWSPALVGGVLLGCATTLPEMLVSLTAVMHDNVGVSLGNAIGSYMANIGLVLGGVAMFRPLKISAVFLKRDLPIMTLSLLLLILLLLDYYLGLVDGLILLLCLGLLIFIIYKKSLGFFGNDDSYHMKNIAGNALSKKDIFLFFFWLLVLIYSSDLLVTSAADLAHLLGVSDLVVGLTIVAIGTSVPELITSVFCVMRGEHAMAVGNVIGSNVLGILGVVAIPGLLSPGAIDPQIVWRDCAFMALITLLLWVLAYFGFLKDFVINRFYGFILFGCFVGYLVFMALL